ncbi:hypothetical protein RB614_03205 [Phytohabitans sp. ZYX-F-186]|uniref:Uncharacterized protein n=1 Tax=Phytohabitans maris TaxID=3071409 RepID=A0ABU0Z8Y9_9ACTN|nr:hypothetical protein [Phytohabitans sp. ZYX-F-186]MDQ7903520.1 hypothetical protein [Phytohabitans sp. ZYX-F-186]
MAEELDNRDQMTMFALLALGRPATNRELRGFAGLEVEAPTHRRLKRKGYMISVKRGGTNVHSITKAGRDWCLGALPAGRLPEAKFPSGVVYAVLAGLGSYLARDGRELEDVFQPDIEKWIRAVYTELTVRRPGQYVRLAKLREWFDGVVIDDELDRMIELPDVHLKAELDQRKLTDDDRRAAVEIGGELRHLLRIGPA